MTKAARVADACLEFDELKPAFGQRVTLGKVAKKHGLTANDLYNFRRGIRAMKTEAPCASGIPKSKNPDTLP